MNRILAGVMVIAMIAVGWGGYELGARRSSQNDSPHLQNERTILYYRNPMGLPDTSPVPKKDAMGMDYVPVYEGDEPASSAIVSISPDKVQKLGVKSEAAMLRPLDKTLRVSGRIEIDERRVHTVAPKFEGWVEKLYANSTGQTVSQGQPLFEVYSPELVSAQREQALAAQGLAALKDADEEARASMQRLADAAAARLKNWNIADGQTGKDRVTFHAPASGVVLEKKAVQGMRFMPGEMLYQIADLSSVWVIAEVPEQDIGAIVLGSRAQVSVEAYPGQTFDGRIAFIYPTLNAATRTVQVRMEIANPKGLLKPAMFASAEIATGKRDPVLTVPVSAVIDSGVRQAVLVQLAAGRYEPRAVKLGARSGQHVEVLAGLAAGEAVVTSANFLIDAESNLKAALGGFGTLKELPAPAPQAAPAGEHSAHAAPAQPKKKASIGHSAQGVLEALNADGSVSITHEPIAALGWPGMTMDFALANSALAKGIAPGSSITFELVERGKGEWIITKMNVREQSHAEHHH